MLAEFEQVTTLRPLLTDDYVAALRNFCEFLQDKPLKSEAERKRCLLANINRKFRLNRSSLADLYRVAARYGTTFNYHEKESIQLSLDLSDREAFTEILYNKGMDCSLVEEMQGRFRPIGRADTVRKFVNEVIEPSQLRREIGNRQINREILISALSAFVFSVAEKEIVHSFFDKSYLPERYNSSFWHQLGTDQPHLFNRECALEVIRIDSEFSANFKNYGTFCAEVMRSIRRSYLRVNNYGYLAIWVEPIRSDDETVTWKLIEAVKLFSEKFLEVSLTQKYFEYERIAEETASYIAGLDRERARFDLANEGFTYRDCFVLSPSEDSGFGTESLLILFQKNQRDETAIPCPTCRSYDVRGNSYPTLGVRSWECGNQLCPDRSKYNRGKRYSFKSLLMQQAISRQENMIPDELIRRWSRDVQVGREPQEVVEMLVRFYSLDGDTVNLVGFGQDVCSESFGRKVRSMDHDNSNEQQRKIRFADSSWFQRYMVKRDCSDADAPEVSSVRIVTDENQPLGSFQQVHGDAVVALHSFNDNYFDGAVTSPPYYNAKDYVQWPNIYCYLYDMFGVIEQCYRVLKPGAFFLFNIFDNFDNEKSIVFSAMGNKKLVLSSMLSDLFQRAGFQLLGNVVWDKGEIEGKRAFNGGNQSPYYQSPFNCWEHILVFMKPQDGVGEPIHKLDRLPSILRAQPVVKMIRGENRHGHPAPFPIEVPALLARLTSPGSILLDPFGGSGTSARALCPEGMDVVCIEKEEEYCRLAERLFERHAATGTQINLIST